MSIKDLTLARQAKVADDNIGDDRLEDEEWDLISTARLILYTCRDRLVVYISTVSLFLYNSTV